MLDNLLEIEVAYSLLKGGDEGEDPIDAHYKKLKTEIKVGLTCCILIDFSIFICWTNPFVILGVLGLILSLIFYFFYENPVSKHYRP